MLYTFGIMYENRSIYRMQFYNSPVAARTYRRGLRLCVETQQ